MTPRLLAPHEVTVAGVTARPDAAWVTQQARNAAMDLNDRQVATRFVLRDHDAKFTGAFDEIFRTEGAEVIRTPIRAPRANAYAERWVQTVRGECLDWTLVLGRRHLLRLLRVYVRHYNEQRPHRGLALRVPCLGSSVQQMAALTWSGVVMCSAVSSMSIRRSQRGASRYLRPTGAARRRSGPS